MKNTTKIAAVTVTIAGLMGLSVPVAAFAGPAGTPSAANSAPVPANDWTTAAVNTPRTIKWTDIGANDYDADGDSMVLWSWSQAKHGSLSVADKGTAAAVLTYTPYADYTGVDSFNYDVKDTTGALSKQATVTVTVANTKPVAHDDYYVVSSGKTLTIGAAKGLLANDTDADGDAIYTGNKASTPPAHGTVTMTAPQKGGFTYTPKPGFAGYDEFTYSIIDSHLGVATATVGIQVRSKQVAKGLKATSPKLHKPSTISGYFGNQQGYLDVTVTDPKGHKFLDVPVTDANHHFSTKFTTTKYTGKYRVTVKYNTNSYGYGAKVYHLSFTVRK